MNLPCYKHGAPCGVLPVVILAVLAVYAFDSRCESLREWIDEDTGHRIVRLSNVPGESESFYFHQNAFTAEGDKMVFANTGTNHARDLYVLDWKTKMSERLTDGGTNRGEVAAPKSRSVFYMRDGVVYATGLDKRRTSNVELKDGGAGYEMKEIARLPLGWHGLTINADETLLAGAYGERSADISRGRPRSYWFEAIYAAKLPHLLFIVEVATGKTNIIHRGNDWFNHVQFSPTDPSLLMFCHEGPWHLLDRIWNIRTDGSGLRLMHERGMPNEIAGHEFWSPDGKRVWFDLQVPRGQKFVLAGVEAGSAATTKEIRYPIRRDEWSVHFNISKDGKQFAGDGGDEHMVAHAEKGKWIWLFTPQVNGTLKAEHLVNMAKHDYSLEPNVNFTPDGKWIVFRGNFEGSRQVYAVEVDKDTKTVQSLKQKKG